jgi:hypothetical protein
MNGRQVMERELFVIVGDKECVISPDLIKKYGIENMSRTPYSQLEIQKREKKTAKKIKKS